MPSFDIVSKIDMPSVQNALDGVKKEINTRYDFKGSLCEVVLQDDKIILKADDELKRRQVEELILTHLTRKKVDAGALEFEKPEAATGNSIRQSVLIKQGVDRETAQKIIKAIKGSKIKLQTSIQGDEVRVSGKKRDDLQNAIQLIKELNLKHPLQYENFRD
ncbi:YajQ family cyclic di-GMP-binding protein [Alphaproteobacteria bacterium]|nr:YajQ family cyclic di-GMP-binding protein [Alphaproteobacteria bacterium]